MIPDIEFKLMKNKLDKLASDNIDNLTDENVVKYSRFMDEYIVEMQKEILKTLKKQKRNQYVLLNKY